MRRRRHAAVAVVVVVGGGDLSPVDGGNLIFLTNARVRVRSRVESDAIERSPSFRATFRGVNPITLPVLNFST